MPAFRTLAVVDVTVLGPAAVSAPAIAATPREGTVSAPLGTAAEAARVLAARRLVVLTGAGLSTDSGIPDYRGPDSPPRSPMTYDQFVSGYTAQQRYWARSHLGWQRIGTAVPNAGHRAVAALEAAGRLTTLITQNVDGLHEQAGSRAVVDLHGRIDDVVCLNCRRISSRQVLHERLTEANPGFGADAPIHVAPDGDVEYDDTSTFRVLPCTACGGVLKPDVVFFGETVPADRVARCYEAVDQAEAMLAAGTSLTVMSGLRFVRHAARRGIPIVVVNRGITRGDPLAVLRVDDGCSSVLPELASRLT